MRELSYIPVLPERIVALDPMSRGFGFVVVEADSLILLDWGVSSCRQQATRRCRQALRRILACYEPTALVLEAPHETRVLRHDALIAFMKTIGPELEGRDLEVHTYSRDSIRDAFASAGALTKESIAKVLARRFPELLPRLPPPRRAWESEAARMGIFDALSLALTHLASRERAAQAA